MPEATARLDSERLQAPSAPSQPAFAKQALLVLLFTLGVILFGAVVRITGSGAGCGQHWPTCQGEVIHLPRKLSTLIELTHRTTSGLSALLVFWLTFRAFRAFGPGSAVRRAMVTASALMVVEALIGALLVRRALVGENASLGRAVVMSLHLVSTSALTASLALAGWWSLPRAKVRAAPERGLLRFALVTGFLVILVSASGAITALGDTLYPVQPSPLSARLSDLDAPSAHFLERLRVVHPLLAIATGALLLVLSTRASDLRLSPSTRLLARAVLGTCLLQIALGSLNVLLSAPGWMQVLHLLVATLLWLSLVLLSAELAQPHGAA